MPDPRFTITPAADPGDIDAVADLFRTYARSLDIDLAYQEFEEELAALPGKYAPPKGAMLLARDHAGTPIGCVALRLLAQYGWCEMKRLYVAPQARGSGLGEALVENLCEIARTIGYTEMVLDTLPGMAGAQALYRRLGFAVIDPYYDTPIAGTLFMRRRLTTNTASTTDSSSQVGEEFKGHRFN